MIRKHNGGGRKIAMANKTYTVVKDGETIKEVKSLPAAKKLADTEKAEVFCGGECVYEPVADSLADKTDQNLESSISALEEIPEVKDSVKVETITPEKYILTAKMNIRKEPSKTARIQGIAKAGTIVEVLGIEKDWLHLTDDTFILYEGGRWAEKVQ